MKGSSKHDRFGNPFSPGVPYARGKLLSSTADDISKLKAAWAILRSRIERDGLDSVYMLSGLERGLHLAEEDLRILDDEIAPALCLQEMTDLALDHLGGNPVDHDVMVLNRLTAALLVAADVMIEPGDKVVGVSAAYSHPAVVRAVAHAGGTFVDTTGVEEFRSALSEGGKVSVVALTRLAVTYQILPEGELREIVRLAKQAGAKVLVDDAGGARVGPAAFNQPKTLEFGVDVGATGLDKYGTIGPRLGLLAGDVKLVEKIRARAFEMGVEARPMLYPAVVRTLKQYSPARVRELVESTRSVAAEMKARIGSNSLFETTGTIQIRADDLLDLVMERGGLSEAPVVPYEATAGLAMLLLRDYGILTVHFAGLPPGTSALMIKFVPPETLARLGGPGKLAEAIDGSITELAKIISRPEEYRELIRGAGDHLNRVEFVTRPRAE